MEQKTINVLWIYPDLLNLHGDRGNLMVLPRLGRLLGLEVDVRRHDDPQQPIDFGWADLLFFGSGELRLMPIFCEILEKQREALDAYVQAGKAIVAINNSGALLATETTFQGQSFAGLQLLQMDCAERPAVYGDDLLFALDNGLEMIGCQVQVMDTTLRAGQAPLGKLLYGRGNNGDGTEGACTGNILFTNLLGPLFAKNPRFGAQLLRQIAAVKGLEVTRELSDADVALEDKSLALLKPYIFGKSPGAEVVVHKPQE